MNTMSVVVDLTVLVSSYRQYAQLSRTKHKSRMYSIAFRYAEVLAECASERRLARMFYSPGQSGRDDAH